MLTEDGSRHHLRFDVREVERTAKHMRQRCVMLYDQAALDTAVAAERERCERWAFLEDREGYLLSKIQSGERAPE